MERLLSPSERRAILDTFAEGLSEMPVSVAISRAQDAKTARIVEDAVRRQVAEAIFEELERGNLVAPEVSLQRAYKALKAKYGL